MSVSWTEGWSEDQEAYDYSQPPDEVLYADRRANPHLAVSLEPIIRPPSPESGSAFAFAHCPKCFHARLAPRGPGLCRSDEGLGPKGSARAQHHSITTPPHLSLHPPTSHPLLSELRALSMARAMRAGGAAHDCKPEWGARMIEAARVYEQGGGGVHVDVGGPCGLLGWVIRCGTLRTGPPRRLFDPSVAALRCSSTCSLRVSLMLSQ
jgi:hypothetical protein